MNPSHISTQAADGDYLIRFAFERIRQLESEIRRLKQPARPAENFVWIYQSKKLIKISLSDILYIRSESNYSRLFLRCGIQYFMSRTLKSWLNELPESGFLRCHRSFLVNTSEILEINRNANQIILRNGVTIPVSRRHQKNDVVTIICDDERNTRLTIPKPKCTVHKLSAMLTSHSE